jgi:3-oxoacyl-[acyl-carrier protein] reductase
VRFDGAVAVVTGGGAGIGAAICARLTADGARVAVLDVSAAGAERVVARGDGALALQVDVTDVAAVDAAAERVEEELGPLAIWVNNAGAVSREHLARVAPRQAAQRAEAAQGRIETPLDGLVRLTDDDWRLVLTVHLDGTFYGTRAAARAMVRHGGGAIVNMASICGIQGCEGHPHYSAAKAGILGLTRAVAKELILQGVRVNAIAPGHVDTATLRDDLDERRRAVALATPIGRLARAEEIAAAVSLLASDETSYFVGATLSPNGGLLTAV